MKTLVIIPARGGSKGVPGKNIKLLNGKPLIQYTIEVAKKIAPIEDICLTTDDPQIIDVAKKYGLIAPFIRPAYLATDTSTTYEVLLHALTHYELKGNKYEAIILLQPTSPFRRAQDVMQALELYESGLDMVVSVNESTANPYYNSFEEDLEGFLHISKGDGKYERRQDAPTVWEYNGAIFIINIESLKKENISQFKKVRKTIMSKIYSVDIDSPIDWVFAEALINNGIVSL